jgi:replicative DNA helicase
MTGGLQPGELIILAARPSMGKTALALNIARNAAILHGKKVAVFSLEMTSQALVMRMLSSEAEVDQSKFRTGYITSHEYRKLQEADNARNGDGNHQQCGGNRTFDENPQPVHEGLLPE